MSFGLNPDLFIIFMGDFVCKLIFVSFLAAFTILVLKIFSL